MYKFPLDEGTVITGFTAELDGRKISGRVQAKEDAMNAYDDAVASGHTPAMLMQEKQDVFEARLGNLQAGHKAIIALTYACEIPMEGEMIRFTLPTTIAPHYGGGDISNVTGDVEYVEKTPYTFGFSAVVETSNMIQMVESPTHAVRVECDKKMAIVKLAREDEGMNRDLVLLVKQERPFFPR